MPSDNIVEIFNELVEPICLLKYNLSEKNVRLKDTRDLLLPKLISGDLDVSEMDIRVPEDEASAEELSESTVGATI